jgi:hypothetical protein
VVVVPTVEESLLSLGLVDETEDELSLEDVDVDSPGHGSKAHPLAGFW